MSRISRNGKKTCDVYTSDVTVHDFADTRPGQCSFFRTKKGGTIINKQGLAKMSEEAKEDTAWFDKNLEDFDHIGEENYGTEEDEEKDNIIGVLKKSPRKMKRQHSDESMGTTYPVDLWNHVSRFIHPENIGTFSLLCKGSYSIVNTVQFWKTLHLRYYTKDIFLPENLGPSSLECIHGLRARVIQMLYYVYSPLVARIQTSVPFQDQPHCLVGQRCILTWHKKIRNMWKFYFKFCKNDKIDISSNIQRKLTSVHFEKWHQDLFYNPDKDCAVLEAVSKTFVKLPIIMGLVLNRVYLNVSSASMLNQKLKLVLDTNYRTATAKNQSSMVELVLDPVLEARVYPWWDPKYHESHSCLEVESEWSIS